MYNPSPFKDHNISEAFAFMEQNIFTTIISVADGTPLVSHLPVIPIWNGTAIELIGHLAKANPHCNYLTRSEAKVIFHGPHTYISPAWYEKNDVPTWNYLSLHISGKVNLIEDYDGIVESLKILSNHSEKHWPSGWEFFIPERFQVEGRLTKSVVAFKITINEINFKKKLSQNKSKADTNGILKGLRSRKDENSNSIRLEMIKLQEKERN